MELTKPQKDIALIAAADFYKDYVKDYGNKRPVAIEALQGAFMDWCFKYAGTLTIPEYAFAFEAVKALIPTKQALRVVH